LLLLLQELPELVAAVVGQLGLGVAAVGLARVFFYYT
jgi:uncharacterized membrane protein YtjA (UPF0391 family)